MDESWPFFPRVQIGGPVNAAAEHTLQIDVIARRWLRFLWTFDASTPPQYSLTFRVILLTVLHVSLHTVALITYSNGAITCSATVYCSRSLYGLWLTAVKRKT